MHAGKSYRFLEFLLWTRRSIYALVLVSAVPVVLYEVAGLHWLSMPWGVVLLLGTAVALMAGFKNTQTYGRTWEAQQAWSAIRSRSQAWGALCRDQLGGPDEAKAFVYRHLAWLAALRHEMRGRRAWETVDDTSNAEYKRRYRIPEKERSLEDELAAYLPCGEVAPILTARNRPARVLDLQGEAVAAAARQGRLPAAAALEMQRAIAALYEQQCRSELVKDTPYPRQYAIVNTLFVRILCVLLPLAMINEMEGMNAFASGFMQGNMVWLAIPLSVLVSWMYTSLDHVGESTANPFEGGANDVPISSICSAIEADLRQMLGETGLPVAGRRGSDIVL
jgi:putative membrane protein